MFFLGAVNSRFRFSRPLYLHAGTPWNEQHHSGWHRPAGIKANDQGGTKAGGGDDPQKVATCTDGFPAVMALNYVYGLIS